LQIKNLQLVNQHDLRIKTLFTRKADVKKSARLDWQVDLRNVSCEFMRCPHAKLMGMGVSGVWTLQWRLRNVALEGCGEWLINAGS
jgi:hypothetical protein